MTNRANVSRAYMARRPDARITDGQPADASRPDAQRAAPLRPDARHGAPEDRTLDLTLDLATPAQRSD